MAQYPPFRTSGNASAAGDLTLTFRTRGNQLTRVTQATAKMVGGGSASCELQLNGGLISPLVATGDAASGDPPVYVGPGDELSMVWAGAPAGALGSMLVIYDIVGEAT